MNCVDQTDPNVFHDDQHRTQPREEKNFDDHQSIQAEDDDHQNANVSSHLSRRNSPAAEADHSSKTNLGVPDSKTAQKSKYASIHQMKILHIDQNKVMGVKRTSLVPPRLDHLPANEVKILHRTLIIQIYLQPGVSHTVFAFILPTPLINVDDENQSHRSERNPPGHSDSLTSIEQGTDKFNSMGNTPIDSMENFARKSASRTPLSESIHPSTRSHLEYPGKKDPNAIRDVEKCLAFYQQMREHFDDDIAAMLLKCCLCYGDCSGKK
jgi:hypothetical protein